MQVYGQEIGFAREEVGVQLDTILAESESYLCLFRAFVPEFPKDQ
jgi:hypothetical protein